MTNPVLTDELIAGLEAAADTSIEGCSVWYEEDGFLITLADTCDQSFMAKASPATVKALLAHIADLKQQLAAASVDADRYRWLRDTAPSLVIAGPLIAMCGHDGSVMRREHGSEMLLSREKADAAIDAARNLATD